MTYDYRDRKIVCVVSDRLEMWQALNVVGHLAISLGARKDDYLMGRVSVTDASGITHPGIARYGLVIKQGNSQTIRQALTDARENHHLLTLDFPREMLDTAHDDELAAALAQKPEQAIEYLGALFYGQTATVNAVTSKLALLEQA
jgi:hypothetical protein